MVEDLGDSDDWTLKVNSSNLVTIFLLKPFNPIIYYQLFSPFSRL